MADKRPDTTNKSTSRGQHRLAPAVVAIILAAVLFFAESQNPAVSELRESLLGGLGITTGEETGNGSAYDNTSDNNGSGADSSGSDLPGSDGQGSGSASSNGQIGNVADLDPDALPEYDGNNYVTVAGNVPDFDEDMLARAGLTDDSGKWKTEGGIFTAVDQDTLVTYEYYGELDKLGRCTAAYGCLGRETMPEQDEERGDISSIHPSGWAKAQHWERSHLIAWALSAENANERNLVTGTHYLNYDGMRPIEEEVEHYIWQTGNHVMYLARPYFKGKELVPRGVQIMARSIEDQGEGISFNVYCFNVTPGTSIDYSTGIVTTQEQASQKARLYVVNKRTGVFHYPSCEGAKSISNRNREEVTATRVEMTSQGYTPCGYCEP